MLKLQSLTFKNIRCFDSEQSVSFDERDKLIQVDGRNENTGGSSGAGKTTVFLALDYLLGISDIPSTLLQSRLTKEPIEVSGQFTVNDKPYTITRGKKSGLTIESDGETVSGNVKLAEEKLDDIIGIPRKIFKKMVHKKQKQGGFFLDMTAKETYEFLVSMLGLQKFIDKAEEINEEIKKHAIELSEIDKNRHITKASKEDLSRVVAEKQKPTIDFTKEDLEQQSLMVKTLETTISSYEAKVTSEVDLIDKPERQIVEFDETKLNEARKDLELVEEKAKKMTIAEGELTRKTWDCASAKDKAIAVGEEIAKLSAQKRQMEHEAVCPTCKRQWEGESLQAELQRLNTEISDKTKVALELKKEIEMLPEYEKQLARLKNIKSDVDGQRDALSTLVRQEQALKMTFQKTKDDEHKIQMAEYNGKVKQIRDRYGAEIDKLTVQKQQELIKFTQMRSRFDSYQKAAGDYEKELSTLAQRIQEKDVVIEALYKQEKEIQKTTIVAQETQRLIKTYTLQTFQETLDLIGDMATEILSAIPNMSSSTIYFEGCKENKDGSLKDEVTAIINMDGNNKVPIKSLSGGERTAIDLAVDLAVIDVIEAKAGKGADFFVIDEPFDGLDSVCKENCLEILKQVDTNKKIIMVDHSSELKEMVSDVITVVKDGESSTVIS